VGALKPFLFQGVAGSPCPSPPGSSMFIFALFDVMDWDRSTPKAVNRSNSGSLFNPGGGFGGACRG